MIRTCAADIPAFISHSVPLPRCCPVSGNPAPGSTVRISYQTAGIVLPVEDLAAWISEYVGGHPSGLREMEAMIQDLARRAAEAVAVPVRVVADLRIDPPCAADQQRMRVSARGAA
ncbi:hypothetical protein [Aureimonas glaciei]|uniref:Uncharacterized protein n=1 Tax=Aureimonas glaciei TaxID=1776957 RepID=A0A917DJS6_9HYPH|nr:hypothetical protein [Aureimonas glaciei]GGD43267.1 hypothetical protein GCM10011335_52400 [Aureimonas glaciei]